MRIWISGGGTAGHVYPALTVLEAACNDAPDVLWLGMRDALEAAIVSRHGLKFQAIEAGPIVGTSLLGAAQSGLRLVRGTVAAWLLIGRERPDVVLVTGGYVGVPVAVAARLRRLPLAVFLPDARPGRAVALVARLADRIAAAQADALPFLPAGRATATGYPVRAVVRRADRAAARARLGCAAERPVVLVFGGSRGARRLNQAVSGAAASLLPSADLVHLAGAQTHPQAAAARAALPAPLRARYTLHAYLHDEDMADALAAADLVVSRAGAAVVGEYPARALPSVLVPLPIAGGHQAHNAAVLEAAGAAVVVADADLDGPRLAAEVTGLLRSPDRLAAMSAAAAALDRPDAAERVWAMLAGLAAERRRPERRPPARGAAA